jgi:hypothetical protein
MAEKRPIILKNKKGNTVLIELLFPIDYDIKNTQKNILICNLHKTTKKYDTIDKFIKASRRNLIINIDISMVSLKNKDYFAFDLIIPKEGIVDDYNINDAIKFFYEYIFEPNTEDDGFSAEYFNLEKNRFLDIINKNKMSDMYYNAENILLDLIDPKEKYHLNYEYEVSSLNECDRFNTLSYYKDIISREYEMFIYGNVSSKVIKVINKYFKNGKKRKVKVNDLKANKQKVKKYWEINYKFKQTIIYNYFRIKDYDKEKDYYYLRFLRKILVFEKAYSIFDKLRLENNLVYDVNVSAMTTSGALLVSCGSLYQNKEVITSLVKECLEDIKDEKKLRKYQKEIIRNLKISKLRASDNYYYKFNVFKALHFDLTSIDKDIKVFREMPMDEFNKFLNRIEFTSTIVVRGCDD